MEIRLRLNDLLVFYFSIYQKYFLILEEGERIRNYWRKYVYRVRGNSCTGTGVLFAPNYLLTAAHLGFERNRTYDVYVNDGTNGERYFRTTCCYIKKQNDLAVLWSGNVFLLCFFNIHANCACDYIKLN